MTMCETKSKIMAAVAAEDWLTVEHIVQMPSPMKTYTPKEYLEHWKEIARCFALATNDESWHEFDKEFSIIVIRMLKAEAWYLK